MTDEGLLLYGGMDFQIKFLMVIIELEDVSQNLNKSFISCPLSRSTRTTRYKIYWPM